MTYSQTLVAHDDILIGHCTVVHIDRAPINPTLPHLFGMQHLRGEIRVYAVFIIYFFGM